MRRPRYVNMRCPSCDARFERFVETSDDGEPLEPEVCGEPLHGEAPDTCAGVLAVDEEGSSPFGSSPLMAPLAGKNVKTNLPDAERQRERLEKRQQEHWKKQGRDEAVSRERAMFGSGGKSGGW